MALARRCYPHHPPYTSVPLGDYLPKPPPSHPSVEIVPDCRYAESQYDMSEVVGDLDSAASTKDMAKGVVVRLNKERWVMATCEVSLWAG